MTKDEAIRQVSLLTRRFVALARAMGKEHPLTKMMGTLAWGRHDWECGPDATKDSYVFTAGALTGTWRHYYLWAVKNDNDAKDIMNGIEAESRRTP